MKSKGVIRYRIFKECERGFTLIEVSITIVVGSLALLGILLAITTMRQTSQAHFERSVALQDANQVIEAMRNTANENGIASLPTTYIEETGLTGYASLSDQEVFVSYGDIPADPLDVTVTVTWDENGTRDTSVSLRTYITQRAMTS